MVSLAFSISLSLGLTLYSYCHYCDSQIKIWFGNVQNTDSERPFKQKRNLMWTVRNLSVFTAFPAHVHCEKHMMQNKWCHKRPSNVDLGGVTMYLCVYIYMWPRLLGPIQLIVHII